MFVCACARACPQNYRKSSIRLAEVESEMSSRVGELLGEVEAATARAEAQKEEVELAKERVAHAEKAMATFKDRIETDYVSRVEVRRLAGLAWGCVCSRPACDYGRLCVLFVTPLWHACVNVSVCAYLPPYRASPPTSPQVAELEALYNDSIARLMARVESLEGVRRTGSSPAVAGSSLVGAGVDRSGGRRSAGVPPTSSAQVGPKRTGPASAGPPRPAGPANVLSLDRRPQAVVRGNTKGPEVSLPMIPGARPGVAWAPVPAPAPIREEELGMDLKDARSLLSSILAGNRVV